LNRENYIKALEQICSRGVENRFGKKIIVQNHFEKALILLNSANVVVLVTGFCIKQVMLGETDGPIGTIVVAKALEKLGKKVSIITDKYSSEFIDIGLEHYNLKSKCITVGMDLDDVKSEELILKINPDVMFFIERPSKNNMGYFNSMSGESLNGIIPDTDFLFDSARCLKKSIIAVGDGGNEAGMNLIREEIVANVTFGNQICAATKADCLIVSGVSNWGCYTVAGGLSILKNQNLLPSVEEEIEHLEKIVASGAVDGVSKEVEVSVDGYSLEENMKIVEDVHKIVERVIKYNN
jgi:hypothetical protein